MVEQVLIGRPGLAPLSILNILRTPPVIKSHDLERRRTSDLLPPKVPECKTGLKLKVMGCFVLAWYWSICRGWKACWAAQERSKARMTTLHSG